MGNLCFPQLSSGALAQFPIRKTRLVRTIKNILPDGSMILFSDPYGGHLVWKLVYTELSSPDVDALQTLFTSCCGSLHGFTFIDPTDNMLAWSSNLQSSAWQCPSLIQVSEGILDPEGGRAGFTLTNTGQTQLMLSQQLPVPSNYQYCFSLYATSADPAILTLVRLGSSNQESTAVPIGPSWNRVVSSGQLNDFGTTLTVGISLAPGQQVGIYGMQLEAQIAPSRYRPTSQNGGVYTNAHWATEQLVMAAEAPNLYSTTISIEAAI